MRICIALAFFMLSFVAVPAAANLPPTLRVTIAGSRTHDEFQAALLSRLDTRAGWRLETGAPLKNHPCTATGPRAGLDIRLVQTGDATLNADVALVDCAAWPVKNWSFSRPATIIGERALAGDVLFALRLWQHAEPSRFGALFDTGDADARTKACLPELSLVKTSDGQLRTVLRAGGPAYRSGLRTNDVILQIDGRDWWEYGTYQSQARAIDGRTHSYTLSVSKRTYVVPCPG